jgi:pSer/pThr/pTyr-binding forkhead associated (FHA) protein
MVVVLYLFLGWALYTLWKGIQRSPYVREKSRISELVLWLEDEKGGGKEFSATQETILIGRDPLCDLAIDNSTISSQHAMIEYELGQWWLKDLQSTNGTFLNGERIEEPIVITDGDQIHCGKIVISVIKSS